MADGGWSLIIQLVLAPGCIGDDGNGTKIASATSGQVVSGLADGTQYSFIVTAANSFGESASSPVVNATTNLYVLYAANGSTGLAAFKMNSATGALSAISGSPYTTLANTAAVTVDPTSHFVYIANGQSSAISGFKINQSDGTLAAISGSPWSMQSYADSIAIDPTGKFLYVSCYLPSGSPLVYTITPGSGALTAISGGTSIAGPNGIAITQNGKFFYTVNNATSNNLYAFTASSTNGSLNGLATSPFYAGSYPNFVATDPFSRFLYIAGYGNNTLYAYKIGSDGTPTAITGPFGTGGGYDEGVVDPSGSFLYVTNNLTDGISAYTINQSTGAPTLVTGSPYATGLTPQGVAADPTGKYVYVANTGTNGGISAFSISGSTGGLSALASSPFATTSAFQSVAIATIVTP